MTKLSTLVFIVHLAVTTMKQEKRLACNVLKIIPQERLEVRVN
jgi:hypothetical protein